MEIKPAWQLRPVIFDPSIGLRRYFWNELNDEQREREIDQMLRRNQQLRKELCQR